MSELLRAEGLTKIFHKNKQIVRAVDDVSFRVDRGSTLALVGESGSGKTTTGRTALRLIEPDAGRIFWHGEDITHADMRRYRTGMQIIFQNPGGSLDPRMTVRDVICEGMKANRILGSKAERYERAEALLAAVGLRQDDALRYPDEFSGGQQQRIGIARALAVDPEFIVCDEAVSALDVSYQSQIINMLEDLQQERGLGYLFISHDLAVVMHIAQETAVMYRGKIVEQGRTEDVVLHPAHPYTEALLSVIPVPDPAVMRSRIYQAPADNGPAPEGCVYYPFCRRAAAVCSTAAPEFRAVAPGHCAACHRL